MFESAFSELMGSLHDIIVVKAGGVHGVPNQAHQISKNKNMLQTVKTAPGRCTACGNGQTLP